MPKGNITSSRPSNFAIIIGAMKSGTTSLFEILSQHPEIAAAKEKEPDYFASEEQIAKGWDWYTSLWNWNPTQHRVALEASVAYTKLPGQPGVARRIAEVDDARFRFIYMMRNPIEQISSHARHAIFAGWEQSLDNGIPDYMIDYTRYAMQVDEYANYFSRDSIYLVTLEQFHAAPESVLADICEFLDIDPSFTFRHTRERFNSGDFFETPKFVSSLTQTRSVRTLAKRILPRPLRHALRKNLAAILSTKRNAHKSPSVLLNTQQRSKIIRKLSPDLSRLKEIYDIDYEYYWGIQLPSDVHCKKENQGSAQS